MKGMVFTEFLDWAEERFTPAVVEGAIVVAELPSGGAYTTVGTYDDEELVSLVVWLGELTAVPPSDIVRDFGKHLFRRFYESCPQSFAGVSDAFDFLENVERHVYVNAKQLDPDAELPRIECRRPREGVLEVEYVSDRGFGDLAEGLIRGCVEHFDQSIEIRRERSRRQEPGAVKFVLCTHVGAVPCTTHC